MLPSIEFRVLGPVEARRGGARLELGGAKRRALLALLLLRANEVVAAERLILDLWGEAAPETTANTLQVNVSQLRKLLGPERIVRESGGYKLLVEEDGLDLQRFERAATAGQAALSAGDFTTAALALEEALALWRGPALAELALEDWAVVEAGRLEELRIAAIEDRIDALLGLGRGGELVAELEALVAEHRLRERLLRAADDRALPGGPASRCARGLPSCPRDARRRAWTRALAAASSARAGDPRPGSGTRRSAARNRFEAPGARRRTDRPRGRAARRSMGSSARSGDC